MTKLSKTMIVAAMLSLASMVIVATPAAAHECTTEKQVEDAEGCNAHSCPDDGYTHAHVHDTPWWDWSQTDHACTSKPTCPGGCPPAKVRAP